MIIHRYPRENFRGETKQPLQTILTIRPITVSHYFSLKKVMIEILLLSLHISRTVIVFFNGCADYWR